MRTGLLGALALVFSSTAAAQSISLTEGEWAHTRATAVRGDPDIETRTICVTGDTAEANYTALVARFSEPLFCEPEGVTGTETGASFTMNCGLGSMYRSGEGEISIQSAEAYSVEARARLNIPGSARIYSTITETATRTGDC
ncbi:DUF3617 family protein [Ponticaulis sp.]|uniref:DUF3617 family protein n=1 Tax=Ponticaulis sp. TaxID=2020902 RepID=UPI0026398A53|nr:DUF3617 family protein [Ponticaulis sp.]MDF1679256.1 hypothetical protein [Ponticaulis sp.]